MARLGVIGGSGIYDIPGLDITDTVKLTTPYGEPSDLYRIGKSADTEVVFLPRHGSMHHIQPNKINYRANLWGFRELGVKKILSAGASGGISSTMEPGGIVVLDQIIEHCWIVVVEIVRWLVEPAQSGLRAPLGHGLELEG